MTAEVVRDVLGEIIDDDVIQIDRGMTIPVDTFVSLFKGCEMTGASLLSHPRLDDMGWRGIIEGWIEKKLV